MWRTSKGDRVLKDAEWALFAFGLALLVENIELDIADQNDEFAVYGLPAFDSLSAEQKLVLVASVAAVLRRAQIPTPVHTAANESAIKAAFLEIDGYIDVEIDEATTDAASHELRRLLLAAEKEWPDARMPRVSSKNRGAWRSLLEGLEENIFWDADFEMGQDVLDLPPEVSGHVMREMRIDGGYFIDTPDEPKANELAAARKLLRQLLGE